MPHELLVTLRQKSRIRNAFSINMSMYIKLSKGELFKIIQSGEKCGWSIDGSLYSFAWKYVGTISYYDISFCDR